MSDELRLICVNIDSPPLFTKTTDTSARTGYEVDVAAAIARAAGRTLRWVHLAWSEMIPALNDGAGDAVLCGQGITEARQRLVDFTRPYAVFDEAILVRRGDRIGSADDLVGRRVLAIAGSTNLELAKTFSGADVIPFAATGDDVLSDLVGALRRGEVDAVVDDEVALQPLTEEADLDIAFSVPTANRWAAAVAKGNADMLHLLDGALAQSFSSGAIAAAWNRWMPELSYPFAADHARSGR